MKRTFLLGLIALASVAALARTDQWEIDSATGTAVCDIAGLPAGSSPVVIDMQGQCVVMHIGWLQIDKTGNGSWEIRLGWPILKYGADFRGG
jgi:hypothetical protein